MIISVCVGPQRLFLSTVKTLCKITSSSPLSLNTMAWLSVLDELKKYLPPDIELEAILADATDQEILEARFHAKATEKITLRYGVFALILNKERGVLFCHRRDLDLWNLLGGRLRANEAP